MPSPSTCLPAVKRSAVQLLMSSQGCCRGTSCAGWLRPVDGSTVVSPDLQARDVQIPGRGPRPLRHVAVGRLGHHSQALVRDLQVPRSSPQLRHRRVMAAMRRHSHTCNVWLCLMNLALMAHGRRRTSRSSTRQGRTIFTTTGELTGSRYIRLEGLTGAGSRTGSSRPHKPAMGCRSG